VEHMVRYPGVTTSFVIMVITSVVLRICKAWLYMIRPIHMEFWCIVMHKSASSD
jgi:hypothetical protein